MDNNPEYDDLDIIGRDAQDEWFDKELPTIDLNKTMHGQTGIQDY